MSKTISEIIAQAVDGLIKHRIEKASYDKTYSGIMLTEYAGYFGINEEDVVMLFDYGYDELEIEEMLYEPMVMQECISELRMMEMC